MKKVSSNKVKAENSATPRGTTPSREESKPSINNYSHRNLKEDD